MSGDGRLCQVNEMFLTDSVCARRAPFESNGVYEEALL